MQFSILGTSSSGNASLLVTEHCKVLIDAGFSCKRLCGMLEERGVKPEEIDAIFLTHEHSDHTAGVSTFCKRFRPKVFANLLTAKALQPKLKHRPDWQIFNTGATFDFQGLTVESFSVPHDAHDPVAFTFQAGNGDDLFSPIRKLAWLTDLGFAPRHVGQRIRDADMLVVEANHDLQLLQDDERRPWSIKQRISGRHGHLSNEAARDLLRSIETPGWKQVFLAHLSSDCNSLEAVSHAFSPLSQNGHYPIDTIASGSGCDLRWV